MIEEFALTPPPLSIMDEAEAASKAETAKPQASASFLLELAVYTVFVSLYLGLALHFLSEWLKDFSTSTAGGTRWRASD